MQEEVENRTVNLAICTTKLSGRMLIAAFTRYMQYQSEIKRQKTNQRPIGQQTIEELIGQNQGASNIPIDQTDIKGFKKILNKYGVDYAVTKDVSQETPKFLVFFKARDTDVLTAAFKEYSASLTNKEKKPSILAQLNKFKELVAALPKKIREKKQERD